MKNQKSESIQQVTPIIFLPRQNYILLSVIEEAEQSQGGIWIPDRARTPLSQGRVVALGPDVPPDATKIGETVIFPMHHEHRIQVDKHWYILILHTDIMCSDLGVLSLPEGGRQE